MTETPTQSFIKRLDARLDDLTKTVASKDDLKAVASKDDLKAVVDRLGSIEKTLFLGNGKPSLMERISLAEVGQKTLGDKVECLEKNVRDEESNGHHFLTFKGIGEKLILPVTVAILMLLLTHLMNGG